MLSVFNPTKVDITSDAFLSKLFSQDMFPRLFEEAYRVLAGNNREVSVEGNQILSEAGYSLIFGANENYADIGRT